MTTSANNIEPQRFMLNRRQFGLLGAAFGTMTFSGLKAVEAADDTLTISYSTMTPSRHPYRGSSTADWDVANMLFDPLLSYDPDRAITPILGVSRELVSPTQTRIRLREGVKFHDGKPLTAADVKYTLEKTKDPMVSVGLFFRWLERVDVIDDLTVDVVSTAPYRLVDDTLAYVSFILPEGADLANYPPPIGTGPYRFVEFIPNNRVVVERNEDYWGPAPKFQKIIARIIPENATRVAALVSGEVDFADNIPVEEMGTVEAAGLKVLAGPSFRSLFVIFNRTVDSPLNDKRVRKAINHAIDRDGIREALYGGLGSSLYTLFAPGLNYARTDLPNYEYNPEKARALLAEAGYPNGFETNFITPNNRYMKDSELAEVIVGQLQEVGIRVQLHRFDWPTYLQEVQKDRDEKTGKYGMSMLAFGLAQNDIDLMFRLFSPNNFGNFGGFQDDHLSELIAKASSTLDKAEVKKVFDEAQEFVWEEATHLPLLLLPQILGVNTDKIGDLQLRADEHTRWAKI